MKSFALKSREILSGLRLFPRGLRTKGSAFSHGPHPRSPRKIHPLSYQSIHQPETCVKINLIFPFPYVLALHLVWKRRGNWGGARAGQNRAYFLPSVPRFARSPASDSKAGNAISVPGRAQKASSREILCLPDQAPTCKRKNSRIAAIAPWRGTCHEAKAKRSMTGIERHFLDRAVFGEILVIHQLYRAVRIRHARHGDLWRRAIS